MDVAHLDYAVIDQFSGVMRSQYLNTQYILLRAAYVTDCKHWFWVKLALVVTFISTFATFNIVGENWKLCTKRLSRFWWNFVPLLLLCNGSLLCGCTPLFPTPKFPHGPLGVGGWPLGHEERRCFQDFQPIIMILIHQRYRQTDGQTDDMQSHYRDLHYSASCGNNFSMAWRP